MKTFQIMNYNKMAYEAEYSINKGKRFKEQRSGSWYYFGDCFTRDVLWLEAEFKFTKDIKNCYAYTFPTRTLHGREIAGRIKGAFLEKYLREKEGFIFNPHRLDKDKYIHEKKAIELSIFFRRKNSFQLKANKDARQENIELNLIDLDALNEAIITGRY